jgi:hypothetical protein
MSNLSQNPPQGIQSRIDWCIAWIYQLRGRISSSGGGGGSNAPYKIVAAGKITLVSGSVLVSHPAITSNSMIFVVVNANSLESPAYGQYITQTSPGSGFLVVSVDPSGGIVTGDVSILNYIIVEPS